MENLMGATMCNQYEPRDTLRGRPLRVRSRHTSQRLGKPTTRRRATGVGGSFSAPGSARCTESDAKTSSTRSEANETSSWKESIENSMTLTAIWLVMQGYTPTREP